MTVGGNWERKVKAGAPSYHQQFNNLKGCKDYEILATPYAKPSKEEQVRRVFYITAKSLGTRSDTHFMLAAVTPTALLATLPPAT